MPVLGPDAQPIASKDIARIKANAERTDGRGRWLHPNDAASFKGTFMAGWRTNLGSADADYLFDRDTIVARSRDLGRNDSVAQAAGQRRLNSAVGFKWRLVSKINARALNITPEQARELRSQIEARFEPYAYGPTFMSCAERKRTFGQNLRMSAAHIFHDGEALDLVEWAADEPTKFKTRLRVVDPDRLSNEGGQPNTDFLRGGVETNAYGVPLRYFIREQHPFDIVGSTRSMIWNAWDRYATDDGRPQVLHAFDALRAGQTRGVTRFVATLKNFRALQKFTDATLEAAVINALIFGFVSSESGPSAINEALGVDDYKELSAERREWHNNHEVTFDGGQFVALPPGDKMEMATTSREVAGFDAFTRAILRLIAASLGITYEELSMDFSQTNYSSARAALAIAWQETLSFRGLIKAQIADPFFLAWLEEAFDNGEVELPKGAPAFWDAADSYVQCEWIGPARGYIDEVKEILAAAARIEAGVSTLADECGLQGKDWREVMEQRAAEAAYAKELGLPAGGADEAQAIQDTKNPAKAAPSPTQDPAGDPAPGAVPEEDQRPPDGGNQNKQGRASRLSPSMLSALAIAAAAPESPAPARPAA